MPSPRYYLRTTEIRRALARVRVQEKLRDKQPDIPYFHEGGNYEIQTEGVGVADENTAPCGVVFSDGSFLTIGETWSKANDELLAYSYHYQRRGGPHVRFDMDKTERPGIPRHHVQFSAQKGARGQVVHAPTNGAVTIEQVLDMIVGEFF